MAQRTKSAPQPDPTPDAAGKARPRLTYAQRALILQAKRDAPNATAENIANTAGCSVRHVYRVLRDIDSDVRQLTGALLHSAAVNRIADWAQASRVAASKGFHQPAKDWLIACDAIQPTPQPQAPSLTVQLAFALPGIPQQLQAPAEPVRSLHANPTDSTAIANRPDSIAHAREIASPQEPAPRISPESNPDPARQT